MTIVTRILSLKALAVLLALAGLQNANADPLEISLGNAFPSPVYSSGAMVTGLSAMLLGGFDANPISWNFNLIGHDCPGTLTAVTTPVRGVEWTGMGAVSGASPIQCSIEIEPRSYRSSPAPITLVLDCNGCSGGASDRDTLLVTTGLAGDVEIKLQFNESEETGTIAGHLSYRNVGLAQARNLMISILDPDYPGTG